MKFSTYDPTVKTNNIQGEIRVPADKAAWGISTNTLGEVGKGIRQIGLAISQREQEADKQTILKAMNLYNQGQYGLMYNAEDGLMNTKLEGSEGIDATYLAKERELRGQVLGVTKLHNKRNMLALTNLMDKSAMQGFQNVDRHRQQQHEKVLDVNLENNIQALTSEVIKDPSSIENAMTQMGLLTSLRYQGQGKEILDAAQRQNGTRIVSAVLNDQLQKENYAGARETLNSWGHCLDAKQLAAFEHTLQAQEKAKAEADRAKELVDKYGEDIVSIRSELDGQDISDASKRRILGNADAEISFREKARRRAVDAAYRAVENTIFDMFQGGKSLAEAESYARRAAGNAEALKHNLGIVKTIYGATGSRTQSGEGRGMSSADFMYLRDVLLARRKFKDQYELADYLDYKGANDEQKLKASKLYDQALKGEGQYAWTEASLDDLRSAFDDRSVIAGLQGVPTKDRKNIAWGFGKRYARMKISEYIADHEGAIPTPAEVRGFLEEAGTVKTISPYTGELFPSNVVKTSPVQLLSAGIADATPLSDVGYLYDVRFTTNRERKLLSREQLDALLEQGSQSFLDYDNFDEIIG